MSDFLPTITDVVNQSKQPIGLAEPKQEINEENQSGNNITEKNKKNFLRVLGETGTYLYLLGGRKYLNAKSLAAKKQLSYCKSILLI